MKQLHPKLKVKRHLSWKPKALALLLVFLLAMGLCNAGLRAVNNWFEHYRFQFNKPVVVTFKAPIEIKEREIEVREIVKVIGEIPNPVDLKTDTEKYIYEKFGIEDYKVAIAITRAESGLREDAININTNSTIDLGIFQINSVHFKKEFCTLKDVVTMKGNVDCAYEIYKASGWSPWVAFNTGAFTKQEILQAN